MSSSGVFMHPLRGDGGRFEGSRLAYCSRRLERNSDSTSYPANIHRHRRNTVSPIQLVVIPSLVVWQKKCHPWRVWCWYETLYKFKPHNWLNARNIFNFPNFPYFTKSYLCFPVRKFDARKIICYVLWTGIFTLKSAIRLIAVLVSQPYLEFSLR